VEKLSDEYSVSQEVVLRRLLIAGKVTADFYRRKRSEFLQVEQGKGGGRVRGYPKDSVPGDGLKYCIDTSTLLDGWVRWYPPNTFHTLWSNIEEFIEQEVIVAPEEVLTELTKKDDDVHKWAKRNKVMFLMSGRQFPSSAPFLG
jgi:hypothetical protein